MEDLNLKLKNLSDTLIENAVEGQTTGTLANRLQPSEEALEEVISCLKCILFPYHHGKKKTIAEFAVSFEHCSRLEEVYTALTEQIALALLHDPAWDDKDLSEREKKAEEFTVKFLEKLPEIQRKLNTDLIAGFEGDPAAYNTDEILYSYPGYHAITVNRIAHELYKMHIPLIPRIMSETAHQKTGIDIHPGAEIGDYFFIDHGTGVVIGETTVIGEHVKIYQGVTLGGLSTRAGQGLRGKKRHPTIEDNVTIYSNASILGGETVIGEGSIIGGNCFITSSVPAHMRVNLQSQQLNMRPDENK